jgi:hypothetical protein
LENWAQWSGYNLRKEQETVSGDIGPEKLGPADQAKKGFQRTLFAACRASTKRRQKIATANVRKLTAILEEYAGRGLTLGYNDACSQAVLYSCR